jgi:dGTPase
MNIRTDLEAREESLHSNAARSKYSERARQEEQSPVRTDFQRDRDRILHSKSFRRLKHKTQVFISPEGDHYRTRLTHTLEVSQISRTIARALNLNEDLTEAISLGHDLGHTPFGHTGEKVLDEILPAGFKHYHQSLRVVDKLEYDGKGLNLTQQVRDGIFKHSKGLGPIIPKAPKELPTTLEGQIVRISDLIAYINHDLDDAIRAELIKRDDIPATSVTLLGSTFAKRIDTVVTSVIRESLATDLQYITMPEDIYNQLNILRDFLFANVYTTPTLGNQRSKIKGVLQAIFDHIKENPTPYIQSYPTTDTQERRIIDFIAGMTDNYALKLFKTIAIPRYVY